MSRPYSQDTLAAPLGPSGRTAGVIVASRYQLERRLGAGAMGEVWEARHMLLDRLVALKLLGVELRPAADRLVLEAQALARVRHPAVVQVYDCGALEDGTPYIAMERLWGETLASVVRRSPLPVVLAVRLFLTLLDGLAAAHRAGVIHRDLKPDNIFLIGDATVGLSPKLLDFGIAWIADGRAHRTVAGGIVGTPAYMSPEQFRGEHSGESADLWSVTASLYEAITGRPPFGAESLPAVMHRVLEAPLPYPRKVPGLDGRLWSLLARGLRKRPDQRFQSAEAMRDEFASWLAIADSQGTGPMVAPAPWAESLPRPAEPSMVAAAPPPAASPNLDQVIRRKFQEG